MRWASRGAGECNPCPWRSRFGLCRRIFDSGMGLMYRHTAVRQLSECWTLCAAHESISIIKGVLQSGVPRSATYGVQNQPTSEMKRSSNPELSHGFVRLAQVRRHDFTITTRQHRGEHILADHTDYRFVRILIRVDYRRAKTIRGVGWPGDESTY